MALWVGADTIRTPSDRTLAKLFKALQECATHRDGLQAYEIFAESYSVKHSSWHEYVGIHEMGTLSGRLLCVRVTWPQHRSSRRR